MLRAIRRRAPGTVSLGTPWSVLFAAKVAGDTVTVDPGVTVLYDLAASPVYDCVEIYGTVNVDRTKTTELKFNCMEIFSGGVYFAGSAANPFPRTFVHTLTPSGARTDDLQLAAPAGPAIADSNRGIMVMDGGELALHATVPSTTIFKLGADAAIGATSLTADRPVTLKANDILVLGTTMYYQEGMSDGTFVSGGPAFPPTATGSRRAGYGTEYVRVTSDVTNGTTIPINQSQSIENGRVVTTTSSLQFRHHGRLQYLVAPAHEDVAGTNLSYTNTAILPGDSFGTVNGNTITGARVLAAVAAGASGVVDNRATVGLLTHFIKFGAPNDSDWMTHGYGAHLMVMGNTSKCQMQGVERYRVGQAGFLGRYPDHQHMRSYTAYTGSVTSPLSGTALGNVSSTYNYVKSCSVFGSSNRGSTIHGTRGFTLYQNTYADIDTHCIFLEDGSEEENVIDGNFVCQVGGIGYSKTAIKVNDTFSFATNDGPAGIWYTNPNNYLRNNIVIGANSGIWNAFSHPYFTSYMERGTHTLGSIAFGTPAIQSHIDELTVPVNETITLTATSSTNLTRVGSVSGAMSAVTTGVTAYHGDENNWSYTVTGPVTPGQTFVFTSKRFFGVFGASRDVVPNPSNTTTYGAPGWQDTALEYLNNECGCCVQNAMLSQTFVIDELGTTVGGPIGHYAIGQRVPNNLETLFKIEGNNLWKSNYVWYQNESDHPHYKGWTCAGARNAGLWGGSSIGIQGNIAATALGGQPGRFENCSFFVKTLDDYFNTHSPTITVLYGGGANRTNCIFVPQKATAISVAFPLFAPNPAENGSTLDLWDFYVYPVNSHFTRDTGTVVLGADPGYYGTRMPPAAMASTFGTPYTTIYGTTRTPWARTDAGALELPADGSLFGQSGGWWVYDSAFFTYGVTGAVTAQSNTTYPGANGKLIPNTYSYVGIAVRSANGIDVRGTSGISFGEAINYTRMQSDGVTAVSGGTWNIGYTDSSGSYPDMRHAAILSGGCVHTSWPNTTTDIPSYPPSSVAATIYGMTSPGQHIVWSVAFNHSSVGAITITNSLTTDTFSVASPNTLAGLLAATDNRYWIDTANDKLYLHIWAGAMANQWSSDTYSTDRKLQRALSLVVA